MKKIILGDIHGNFISLFKALEPVFKNKKIYKETRLELSHYLISGDISKIKKLILEITEEDLERDIEVISCGDLFDRGPDSYLVFLILRQIDKKGKFNMVLGNHDGFFLFPFLTKNKDIQFVNCRRLAVNSGRETIYSFCKGILGKNFNNFGFEDFATNLLNGLVNEEARNLFSEIIEWLSKFGISILDKESNFFVVHGGIMIERKNNNLNLKNEEKAESFLIDINGLTGIDLIEDINRNYKLRDEDTILYLSLLPNNKYNLPIGEARINNSIIEGSQLVPFWYLSRKYADESNKKILVEELKRHNLKSIIVGHDWFGNNSGTKYALTKDKKFFCLRVDHSNFGYVGKYEL